MALSNNVIGAINFVAVLLSIPLIGAGVWLANEPASSCLKILQWPVIILGILVVVVALAGFIGGFWRVTPLLVFYLIAMLVLIVLLGCLVVFVYMVTGRGSSGRPAPSRAYLEYRLDDFPAWLRRRVRSSYKWDRIRGCLSSKNICPSLNQSYRTAEDFFNARLSPLQSGCCKPPTACGYTFVNPTYWISPINMVADMDCLQWSNDQNQVCYNCDSCKGGLLANLEKEWKMADIVLLATFVCLIAVYLIGCCAFRNAKTEDIFRKYRQGNNYT